MPFAEEKLALVVVTFNRADLLRQCLSAVQDVRRQPEILVVVDNASSDDTGQVLAEFADQFPDSQFIAIRSSTNTGGAGGFHRGVKAALDHGADWVFVMDDDVLLTTSAFHDLAPWTQRFWCVQGRREDPDGGPSLWKPYVHDRTWLPHFGRGDEFDVDGATSINSGIFEGMLFHRSVVATIGLPDPRFFIVWDDAMFGWLASRHHPVGYVRHTVLRRMPKTQRRDVADRKVNFSSALYQRYVIRNRGLIAQYLKNHGAYHPIAFSLGTGYLMAKECARIVLTTRDVKGVRNLWQGWQESRQLLRETGWTPMPPYQPEHNAKATQND